MARHRDIRNMDYEDEYDGYDDIYGHSVDDDYCISPSNKQFIYNRDSSRDSRCEDDIQEVDEIDELSDTDRAKLNSCVDQIMLTLENTTIPRSELINLVLKYKLNVERVINHILENSSERGPVKEKVVTDFLISSPKFNIPKFGESAKGFVIPNIFKNNSPKTFTIPNLFQKTDSPNGKVPNLLMKTTSSEENFNTLSDLVSSHLNTLPISTLSKKLTQVEINPQKVDNTKMDFNIDLSKALKTTPSLPNFMPHKSSEDFEIPFIDSELELQNGPVLSKKEKLPCMLDVTNLKHMRLKLAMRPSKLARIIGRKYRHKNEKILDKELSLIRPKIPRKVKVFNFTSDSPDDFILRHLK